MSATVGMQFALGLLIVDACEATLPTKRPSRGKLPIVAIAIARRMMLLNTRRIGAEPFLETVPLRTVWICGKEHPCG